VIGLVGGVGSGKSSLARLLREKYPIQIVEGDSAGHLVLTEPAIKDRLREVFGDRIFKPTGEVDRRQLGQLVFGTLPDQVSARKKLENIVHPRISEVLSQQVEQARQSPGTLAVILDAAVVLESGWRDLCDEFVFVDVPLEQRVHRVRENRGWSREQLQLREASQFPLDQKRREANHVVDNSCDIALALSQLEQILPRVTGPASR
jgi:dephospho-CoA kinase